MSANDDEFAALVSTFPTVGVQQANITGTGARVRVERRDAHEAPAADHLVSLAAPLPPETAEVQVIGCFLVGATPSEAALAGASFVLAFRGEQTEVCGFLTEKKLVMWQIDSRVRSYVLVNFRHCSETALSTVPSNVGQFWPG